MTELYGYQKEGAELTYKFLCACGSAENGSDMGVGKTVMTLEALMQLDVAKVLIVCPASVRGVWESEIRKWWRTGGVEIETWYTGKKARTYQDSLPACSFTVVSYALARGTDMLKSLMREKWDALVLDESHKCNNRKTQQTEACLTHLWPRAKYHICLSGTPFTTRIVDGYNIFNKMAPDLFPNFFQFAAKYSESETQVIHVKTRFGKVVRKEVTKYFGVKNGRELGKLIRSRFYFRFKKAEVLKELPPKIFQEIFLPDTLSLSPKAKTDAEQCKIELHLLKKALENDKSFVAPKSLAELRRMQGEIKVDEIAAFALDILEQQQVVIFAHHQNVINGLREAIEAKKVLCGVINGATKAEDRTQIVNDFQAGKTPCFIGQFEAAGTGLTLTAASVVILAELPWSPGTLQQSIDRCHRIGQKDSVLVYPMLVRGSIDEGIYGILKKRALDFNTVLS